MGSDDEDSVATVRRADAGSADHVPFAHVPEVGKIGDDPIKPPLCERFDVFGDDTRGLNLSDDSSVLTPQSASCTFESVTSSKDADVLAWEAAADDVDGGKSSSCADIGEPLSMWPVTSKHAQAERIALHLPDSARTSGTLKAKLKPTDAAEQRTQAHPHTSQPLPHRAHELDVALAVRDDARHLAAQHGVVDLGPWQVVLADRQ